MSTIERLPPSEPRGSSAPQLALRVAVLGSFALVMFGIIFFRLWYLQVLTGEQYVQQAKANDQRDLPIPAPRGQILDRSGKPIVTTKVTNAVQIVPSELPPDGPRRMALYRRLGRLLSMPSKRIEELVIAGHTALPYAPVTIKTDAGSRAMIVLAERQNDYPGVTQQPVPIRAYPYREMAAQALGYVGQIGKTQLKMQAFRGVHQGTIVGQEGIEYYYDRYLRGQSGVARVQVNAEGRPEPTSLAPTEPIEGHSVKLSLDLGLEREGEKALREGIEHAQAAGKPADAGAYTVLEPRTGQVLAIGSYPSFDPNVFAKPLTEAQYKALIGTPGGGGPLTDRATEGAYPTGSTFKPFTAMAALEEGVINPSESLGGGSCILVSTEEFCNAGKTDYGPVALVEALKVSSDTYFFETGELANSHGPIIQRMAHRLGVGQPTGIDLPKEFQGIVPDPKWRAQRDREELRCERAKHVQSCGYVAEPRPWSVGDNMQLAVGQGDLLTDPMQMAVAYSTLANAFSHEGLGWVVRPHLGLEVDDSSGGLVQTLPSPPVRRVRLNYGDLNLVMEGIHEAASQPGGTSADVWAGWDQAQHPVYGKTGTAEHLGKVDQSWYMCYIPDSTRPVVIAVTVEQGGFGAETAAPIARLLASEWFGKAEKFVAGSSKTR